ncbi:hypothetical protein ACJRO7_008691 [Eucalyptus globulus]|uniref:Tetratricopeptide repeat (TPR)-like superfamily protein n=1 Tax=Eucalyptus globulus TaxID=34317 RepID=A0ABD3IT40_EUCGL
MMGVASRLLGPRAGLARVARLASVGRPPSPSSRFLHDRIKGLDLNPVASQMVDYALNLARSQKSDESYSQGMLVLEQCLSTQPSEGQVAENTRSVVLLAMSTLLYERGNLDEAIDKLQSVADLGNPSWGVKVAAMEALVGLHLEMGQDDTSSVVADKCLKLLEKESVQTAGSGSSIINARAKAAKGLVELVLGSFQSAEPCFQGSNDDKYSTGSIALLNGNVALSYGEFLHSTCNFSLAKETYQKVIQGTSENVESAEATLGACNMVSQEVLLAATCALGQLESHLGNFNDAEEILTKALTKTEEHFGSHHPKVGIILTCIALMFRWKAIREHSSSLLVQEGLLRKATELLKAPALEGAGVEAKVDRRDVVALARGAHAEILCVQENRKGEGERLKSWAESAWRNRRMSLSEALDCPESSSQVPIVDSRICRVL